MKSQVRHVVKILDKHFKTLSQYKHQLDRVTHCHMDNSPICGQYIILYPCIRNCYTLS